MITKQRWKTKATNLQVWISVWITVSKIIRVFLIGKFASPGQRVMILVFRCIFTPTKSQKKKNQTRVEFVHVLSFFVMFFIIQFMYENTIYSAKNKKNLNLIKLQQAKNFAPPANQSDADPRWQRTNSHMRFPALFAWRKLRCAHEWNIFHHSKRNFTSPTGCVICSIHLLF